MAILRLKNKFHQYKNPILIDDTKIDRIVVSKKVPFAKKGCNYFIGYKDGKKSDLMSNASKNECILRRFWWN